MIEFMECAMERRKLRNVACDLSIVHSAIHHFSLFKFDSGCEDMDQRLLTMSVLAEERAPEIALGIAVSVFVFVEASALKVEAERTSYRQTHSTWY